MVDEEILNNIGNVVMKRLRLIIGLINAQVAVGIQI